MGDLGSIPGLEKYPGEGNSYPLQYSGQTQLSSKLESFVDKGKKMTILFSDILQFSKKFHNHQLICNLKHVKEIHRGDIMTYIKILRAQEVLIMTSSIAQVRTDIAKI